jgi:cytidine deaminase
MELKELGHCNHTGATAQAKVFCSALFFGVSTVTVLALAKYNQLRSRQKRSACTVATIHCQQNSVVIHDDLFYLQRAHQLRLALDPPIQSQFRVVCILLLQNGSCVVGTNSEETPNIAGSICAERAALLQYRMQLTTSVITAIYIVTDSDRPIAPGTACREYFHGHAATCSKTRFVLQGRSINNTLRILTLADLHPYPSIYSGRSAQQQLVLGVALESHIKQQCNSDLIIPLVGSDPLVRMLQTAHQACWSDTTVQVHPIRYGACAMVRISDTMHWVQASQRKTVEYSSAQDATCQVILQCLDLLSQQQQTSVLASVIALVQVDQFGIPHAPFGAARSLLVEYGLGHVLVVLTRTTSTIGTIATTAMTSTNAADYSVVVVPAAELAPYVPDMFSNDEHLPSTSTAATATLNDYEGSHLPLQRSGKY